MRKITGILMAILLIFSVSACKHTSFSGSRTGNENELIMEYAILNGTDSQVLSLDKGDTIDSRVVNRKGILAVSIEKENGDPVYNEDDVQSGAFRLKIEESGNYTVTVTGKKAKGSVSFVREKISAETGNETVGNTSVADQK